MHKSLKSLLRLVAVVGLQIGSLLVTSVPAWAQTPVTTPLLNGALNEALNQSLNESVLMIGKKNLFGMTELETTLYKPEGAGPFPVVVINHGKAPGDPKFQKRFRPALAARYFMRRGYVVVVPMRQGFSKSGGTNVGGGCNIESNGLMQAEDVKVVLDYVVAQPWADKSRMLVIGQSHGGWTTLAFGMLNYPGVKGLVDFAGGLRQDGCAGWQGGLARAAGTYGRQTQVPSLWFYGDNDSYFSAPTWQAMHAAYTASGGQARLIAFGSFANDSHTMFGAVAGQAIWQPEMTRFLEQTGLPSQPQPAFERYDGPANPVVPTVATDSTVIVVPPVTAEQRTP